MLWCTKISAAKLKIVARMDVGLKTGRAIESKNANDDALKVRFLVYE
jgi:hypothetical protein